MNDAGAVAGGEAAAAGQGELGLVSQFTAVIAMPPTSWSPISPISR